MNINEYELAAEAFVGKYSGKYISKIADEGNIEFLKTLIIDFGENYIKKFGPIWTKRNEMFKKFCWGVSEGKFDIYTTNKYIIEHLIKQFEAPEKPLGYRFSNQQERNEKIKKGIGVVFGEFNKEMKPFERVTSMPELNRQLIEYVEPTAEDKKNDGVLRFSTEQFNNFYSRLSTIQEPIFKMMVFNTINQENREQQMIVKTIIDEHTPSMLILAIEYAIENKLYL